MVAVSWLGVPKAAILYLFFPLAAHLDGTHTMNFYRIKNLVPNWRQTW